ncbi:hypothetical protein Pmani_038542, partial [Petrolisthes manimaculis]
MGGQGSGQERGEGRQMGEACLSRFKEMGCALLRCCSITLLSPPPDSGPQQKVAVRKFR